MKMGTIPRFLLLLWRKNVAKYWQYKQVKIQLGPEPWIFNADSDHFGYPGVWSATSPCRLFEA